MRRAWLGVGGQTLPLPRRFVRHFELATESGVRVETVERDSPAERAGIRRGDVVVAVDDTPIPDVDALQRSLTGEAIGRSVAIGVLRGDRRLALAATPIEATAVRRDAARRRTPPFQNGRSVEQSGQLIVSG